MPFFDVAPVRPPADEVDMELARRLRKLTTEWASRVRQFRLSKWASEFRILRNEIRAGGGDDSRVAAVLTWYEANHQRDDVPAILSAAGFRRHFDWLERLAKKDRPQVELTADDRRAADLVYKYVKGRPWGRGEPVLKASIERSVVNRRKAMAALERLTDDPDLRGVAKRLLLFLSSDFFLVNWYEYVWRRVFRWEAWSGSFAALEFTRMDKPPVSDTLAKLVASYGDRSLWFKVVERVAQPVGAE